MQTRRNEGVACPNIKDSYKKKNLHSNIMRNSESRSVSHITEDLCRRLGRLEGNGIQTQLVAAVAQLCPRFLVAALEGHKAEVRRWVGEVRPQQGALNTITWAVDWSRVSHLAQVGGVELGLKHLGQVAAQRVVVLHAFTLFPVQPLQWKNGSSQSVRLVWEVIKG